MVLGANSGTVNTVVTVPCATPLMYYYQAAMGVNSKQVHCCPIKFDLTNNMRSAPVQIPVLLDSRDQISLSNTAVPTPWLAYTCIVRVPVQRGASQVLVTRSASLPRPHRTTEHAAVPRVLLPRTTTVDKPPAWVQNKNRGTNKYFHKQPKHLVLQ